MMVGSSKKLYVYYDERYPYSWIPHNIAKIIAKELEKYDFETIDATSLKNILSEGSKTTDKEYVVVFAQDVVPDLILDNPYNPTANSLLRLFLNAGHSIVWIGDVPLYYVGKIDGGKINTPNAMQSVLGINSNFINTNKPVMLTLQGIMFGLPTWIGMRPHNRSPRSGVSPIPLAIAGDNTEYVHAFIMCYKPRVFVPFGFIRIYDFPINKPDLITEQFIRGIISVATRDLVTPIWSEIKILSERVNKIAEELDTKFSTLKSEIDSLKTIVNEILKLEKEILETIKGKQEDGKS